MDPPQAPTPCPMIALSGSPGDVATPVTGGAVDRCAQGTEVATGMEPSWVFKIP